MWEGYQEDGVPGALNAVNPLYWIGIGAADTYIAAEKGDYRAATAAGVKTAVVLGATAATAAQGVGALGRGTGATAVSLGGATKRPPNPHGKLGKPSTRAQNAQIAGGLESEGYQIAGGGGRLPEEYIPGPGGGRRGSAAVDITAHKDGDTVRVQTVDTLKSGVPNPREMRNAGKILKAHRQDGLFLIPK
jgi:hypothetical protein